MNLAQSKLMFPNLIKKNWSALIGDELRYSLESRIFNSVSIFATIVASLNAIINFALGLDLYGYLMIPLIAVLFFGYYLSRYKDKLNIAIGIFAIAFNLLCGGTYFASDASNGVNLFTFVVIIFILSTVTPKKQFWIWIPLNFIFLAILLTIEYLHPEMVKTIYVDKQHKLIDTAQTFFEVVILISIITMYMKKNYNREKELAKKSLIALENSNQTKNKLFSIVAHDLNSPLSSIETHLSLLNEIDISSEEKMEIERQLLSSTRQTSEMLQNILSWAKDQMDEIKVNLSPIFIYETLKHTVSLQKSIAQEKEINLIFLADEDLKVIADPDMLQLVVRNLLNNAIKFSLPGGTVVLSISGLNGKCILSIKDDGIGIVKDQQSSIFSLKSNVTYGTNKEKGVGLGLKLTKTYVELQNGKIWLESELNKGTNFFVSLDLSKD
ncbi:MAG: HAMP domain-containing sensor histidine kinase [Candidatus Pedobacter colombiensis]|uniref:histidine kinase n=1 Tax=Candidatus Pedobacter colombiensis TaxID=3121371 RepID=A0AAJ5WAP3_9SPHI|nr:HAMP domain-containing sensor histidine kinase [Pedobacter sp.]WEK21024.1 MAG: HAMP domain-containing sensor histidine kinase [Pedobacter sp.]